MAEYTTYLELEKPQASDNIDPSVFYNNFDKIDTAVGSLLNASDYIVYQDTLDDWTCRRWHSGIVELWTTKTITLAKSGMNYAESVSIPTGVSMADSNYNIQVTMTVNNVTSAKLTKPNIPFAIAEQGVNSFIIRTINSVGVANLSVTASIHIIGKVE